ncbi:MULTISPECIES: transglutaminase-like cysteine peptidase [unclassified Neptuniibacter]|uniref:transglutaminase-like cysteine peptidase n=1 Tax=unclassified Neptuniibacter TaxID=2630693 RepID=UPI000C606441|nr:MULTISPECIES: transglutaminase-like cysteine peptidase [unclassified Neptuniibacter]MAY42377.1 hypothetical protein [Oceanospirillaceae bacterium]|tara:strand:- start:4509 stop:4868 length:360 start_codon:yes stop_codon:yes gene_type:complete
MVNVDLLKQVFSEAKKRHVYVSDAEQYGKAEHWEPGLMGDCEDFALWCREYLNTQGVKSDLIYCFTENRVGHLVLSVEGWILDNRCAEVVANTELIDSGYQFLRLGDGDGNWFEIVEGE